MPLPRVVKARLVSGRSVPVSLGGKMIRLRVGDDPIDIPYQVYLAHAWKMELVGDSLNQVQAAMMEGEGVMVAPTQVPQAEVVEKEEKEEPLPEWDIIMPPEDYLQTYKKKKNPGPTIKRRLALAKKILKKERDGTAK